MSSFAFTYLFFCAGKMLVFAGYLSETTISGGGGGRGRGGWGRGTSTFAYDAIGITREGDRALSNPK